MQINKIFRTNETSRNGRVYFRRRGFWYCDVYRDANDDICASPVLFDWDDGYDTAIPELPSDSYAVTHGGTLFQKMQQNYPAQKEMIDIFLKIEAKEKRGKKHN